MKSIFCYALLALSLLVGGCVFTNNKKVPNTPSKTEVVNLDKSYRVSNAKFKGHEYLLFESGERGEEGYAIFLEHKADCKVCCEQFD